MPNLPITFRYERKARRSVSPVSQDQEQLKRVTARKLLALKVIYR